MYISILKRLKTVLALTLILCVAVSLLPALANAATVGYMPGVTEEMTNPAFWSDLAGNPDALLATEEDIARINQAAIDGDGTNRRDMKRLKETYDGIAKNEALQKSAQDDADYYLGWVWDQNGKKMTQEDFDLIIANCADPNAVEEMPVRWGIAVNRTELITFPFDGQILDDPKDFDFDYQPLVGIRVNEPVAIYSTSADGKYFQVSTSCCTGWVRAEDIAICKDKEEWLSAWDIPAEKRLVFWGDKMYTDYSKTALETVCRLITMGTVLERMEEMDPDALVINRLPLHNYAVYLPVRNEDGSYGKTPALINARERVSEDYLPLTARNLATVALASLGDAYGWGAGLNNEDCTSLNRSVFCCFGLDLPRNGTWQWLLDFPKAEITYYTLEEKEALLDALPMGALLNFPGHQMMYLGKHAGSYYVVSTVSSLMSPWSDKRQRTRDVQINTLDIKRANGKTWMQSLNRVVVPWLLNEGEASALCDLPEYHDSTAFCLEKGLMDAYPTGYFLPLRTVTTAEAVDMLWRVAGRPDPDTDGEGFQDVASGAPYEQAALWAKQTDVYPGVGGEFRGTAALTWQNLSAMAQSMLQADLIGDDPTPKTAVTRADLAQAAQVVWTAWEEQQAQETEEEDSQTNLTEDKTPEASLIEQLVVNYAAYGERDAQAMAALSAENPVLAEKWAEILDLWESPVMVYDELPDGLPEDDSLCLVVLGFQLNPDGTLREELIERLTVALTASEKYPQAIIVCTGGGTATEDPTATEAGRMAEWLCANGVDSSRILVEDRSITTAQNAIFTFDILETRCQQVTQIAIISSDYHISTGTLLFGAEAILRNSSTAVVSNAAWHAPSGTLSTMFQAGALIELSGDVETAFSIYYETYDIHELPPLHPKD